MFLDFQKTRIKENVDSVKVDLPAVKTKRRLVFEVTANTSTLRKKKVQLCSLMREAKRAAAKCQQKTT